MDYRPLPAIIWFFQAADDFAVCAALVTSLIFHVARCLSWADPLRHRDVPCFAEVACVPSPPQRLGNYPDVVMDAGNDVSMFQDRILNVFFVASSGMEVNRTECLTAVVFCVLNASPSSLSLACQLLLQQC